MPDGRAFIARKDQPARCVVVDLRCAEAFPVDLCVAGAGFLCAPAVLLPAPLFEVVVFGAVFTGGALLETASLLGVALFAVAAVPVRFFAVGEAVRRCATTGLGTRSPGYAVGIAAHSPAAGSRS